LRHLISHRSRRCRFLKRGALPSRLGFEFKNRRQQVHEIAKDLTDFSRVKLNQKGFLGVRAAFNKSEMSGDFYLWICLDLGQKGRGGCSARTDLFEEMCRYRPRKTCPSLFRFVVKYRSVEADAGISRGSHFVTDNP